jgi:hypothetical protein
VENVWAFGKLCRREVDGVYSPRYGTWGMLSPY